MAPIRGPSGPGKGATLVQRASQQSTGSTARTPVSDESRIYLLFWNEAALSVSSFVECSYGLLGQQFGDRLTANVGGEKRICLGACHCLPHVIAVIAFRARERDDGGCEFHLRILPAQSDGFL